MLSTILLSDKSKINLKSEDDEPDKNDILQSELGKRHIYTKDGMSYSYAMSDVGLIELAMLRDNFDDIEDDQLYYTVLGV